MHLVLVLGIRQRKLFGLRVADPASSYAGYVGMVDVNSEYSTLLHSIDDLYPVSGSW